MFHEKAGRPTVIDYKIEKEVNYLNTSRISIRDDELVPGNLQYKYYYRSHQSGNN